MPFEAIAAAAAVVSAWFAGVALWRAWTSSNDSSRSAAAAEKSAQASERSAAASEALVQIEQVEADRREQERRRQAQAFLMPGDLIMGWASGTQRSYSLTVHNHGHGAAINARADVYYEGGFLRGYQLSIAGDLKNGSMPLLRVNETPDDPPTDLEGPAIHGFALARLSWSALDVPDDQGAWYAVTARERH